MGIDSLAYSTEFFRLDQRAGKVYASDGVDLTAECRRLDEVAEWTDLAVRQVMAERGAAIIDWGALRTDIDRLADSAVGAASGEEFAKNLVRLAALAQYAVVRSGHDSALTVDNVRAMSRL